MASDFEKVLAGAYKGPRSLTDAGAREAADTEIAQAQEKANLAGTQGGRVQILRELAGRPQTLGSTRLNSAILGGNAEAIEKVRAAANAAKPLSENLSEAEKAAAARARQIEDSNKALRERGLGGISDYLQGREVKADADLAMLRSQERQKALSVRRYLDQLSRINGAEGRVYAGGSGGLIDANDPIDRARALDVPDTTSTEGRARIASAGGDGEGRATAQRVSIPRYVDEPLERETLIRPVSSVPVLPTAPAPLPIIEGYESLGLNLEQATALQRLAEDNRNYGGTPIDFGQYYSPVQLENLTRANVLTPADAARYTELAKIVGRPGYTAQELSTDPRFNLTGATVAARGSYETARNRPGAPQFSGPISTGTSPGGVPVVSVPGGGQPATAPVYPTTPAPPVQYNPVTGTPVSVGGVPITAAPNQGVPGGRVTSPNNGDDGRMTIPRNIIDAYRGTTQAPVEQEEPRMTIPRNANGDAYRGIGEGQVARILPDDEYTSVVGDFASTVIGIPNLNPVVGAVIAPKPSPGRVPSPRGGKYTYQDV